jgi:PKHD-type hydroxylase
MKADKKTTMLDIKTREMYDPPCTLDKAFNPYVKSTSFAAIHEFLTPEECDKLVAYGDSKNLVLGLDRSGYKSENRESHIAFLELEPEIEWLTNKAINKITSINNKYQKWDLTHLDRFQYTTYQEGGYLTSHNDDYFDFITLPECPEPELYVRKLSISVMLNDPSEYEGGELEIQASKGVTDQPYDIQKMRLPKGSAVVFPSFQIHSVHPVIKGVRKSLVIWFFGPKWR